MNSLPLNPEIIRPNKPATIIFYEVLPVAEFANCMYWHDIEDKSLISLGSVKISRVYHSTYKGFTDRTCADDFSLVHFSGAFVSASQIVTVVEFEAECYGISEIQEAAEPKKSCETCVGGKIGCYLKTYLDCAIGNKSTLPHWKSAADLLEAKATNAMVRIHFEPNPDQVFHGDGKVVIHSIFDRLLSDDAVKANLAAAEAYLKIAIAKNNKTCRSCSRDTDIPTCMACMHDGMSGWTLTRPPEPEHIDDQPKTCETCISCRVIPSRGCLTCVNFNNWMPK